MLNWKKRTSAQFHNAIKTAEMNITDGNLLSFNKTKAEKEITTSTVIQTENPKALNITEFSRLTRSEHLHVNGRMVTISSI